MVAKPKLTHGLAGKPACWNRRGAGPKPVTVVDWFVNVENSTDWRRDMWMPWHESRLRVDGLVGKDKPRDERDDVAVKGVDGKPFVVHCSELSPREDL